MLTRELEYDLPASLIATQPAEPRDAARLLVVRRSLNRVDHHHVRDLPRIDAGPTRGDLLVFNQTRVLPARFTGTRSATQGRVGGLYLHQPDAQHWHVMLESRGSLQLGETITLTPAAQLTLTEKREHGQWIARLTSDLDTLTLLQQIGSTPLPPYIVKQRKLRHQDQSIEIDPQRYNTVFARDAGSVAAPTAALHFTPQLLQQLQDNAVQCAMLTLHIGLGTFAPVRSEILEQHDIHSEWVSIPPETLRLLHETRQRGGRIIPVGTTCVRALESLPDPLPADASQPFCTQTKLFITPDMPFTFRFADALMTNFHLPRSTLLALVASLPEVGIDRLKAWYRIAIENEYRFYSYGDAMLLL